MADLKITGLTADTAPTTDDLIVTVNDPTGTPANRQVTVANLLQTSLLNIPYKFGAYKSSGTPTVNTGSVTQVTFDVEEFDTGSNFASSTFTAPLSGFYIFDACFSYAAVASGTRLIMFLYKNGAEFKRMGSDKFTNALAGWISGTSGVLNLSLNDTIDMRAQPLGANTVISTGQSTTWFSGRIVSVT